MNNIQVNITLFLTHDNVNRETDPRLDSRIDTHLYLPSTSDRRSKLTRVVTGSSLFYFTRKSTYKKEINVIGHPHLYLTFLCLSLDRILQAYRV